MKAPLSPISSVLESFFKKKAGPFSEIYFLFQLKQKWMELAGEEIAKSASPVRFKGHELVLALPDSASLQEMRFAKELLRKKLNRQFPDKKIRKITLRIG